MEEEQNPDQLVEPEQRLQDHKNQLRVAGPLPLLRNRRPNPLMEVLVYTPINERRSKGAIALDAVISASLAGGSLWLYWSVIDATTDWHRYVLFCVATANFIVTGKSAFDFLSYLRFRHPPTAIRHLFVPESRLQLPLMILGAIAASIPTAATAYNTGSENPGMEIFKAVVTLVSNAPINTTSTMVIALKPWLQKMVMIFFLPLWIAPYLAYKGYRRCRMTPEQAKQNKINKQLEQQYNILRKAVIETPGNIEQKALVLLEDQLIELAGIAEISDHKQLVQKKKELWGKLYPTEERKAVLAEEEMIHVGGRHRCAQGLRAVNIYIAGGSGFLLGFVLSAPDGYYTVQTAMSWFESFSHFWHFLAVYTMIGVTLPVLFTLTIDFCVETLSKLLDTLSEIIDTESDLSFVSKFYHVRNYIIYVPSLVTGTFSSGAAYYIASGIKDDMEDWGRDAIGDGWGVISEILLWMFVSAASCFNIRSLLSTKDDGLFNWAFWLGSLPAKGCAISMDYLSKLRTNYDRMIGSAMYDGLVGVGEQGRRLFLGKMTEAKFQEVKAEVVRLRGEIGIGVGEEKQQDVAVRNGREGVVIDVEPGGGDDDEEPQNPQLVDIGREHSINVGRGAERQQRDDLRAPLLPRGGRRGGSFIDGLRTSASTLVTSFSAMFGKSALHVVPPRADIPLVRSNLGQRGGDVGGYQAFGFNRNDSQG